MIKLSRKDKLTGYSRSQLSNAFSARGKLENLSAYLIQEDDVVDFMITGGVNDDERFMPLFSVLYWAASKMPVVILHSNDLYIETMAEQAWQSVGGDTYKGPLWRNSPSNRFFEPFYGMNERQIIKTVRALAGKLGYTVTPRFERVANAHLSILRLLDIPYSLTGLYYLCQFLDIGEFHDNVLALPCEEEQCRRIWADIDADDESRSGQFDLFRTIINSFAHEAEYCGWDSENNVHECNAIKAVEKGGVYSLVVNDMYSTLIQAYLAEELKICSQSPFFLIIDSLSLHDKELLAFLCTNNSKCRLGILSENAVAEIGESEKDFLKLAESLDCIVILKHSASSSATVLAELIGKQDYTKSESAEGYNRGFFRLVPKDKHTDIRYSVENRYKVMPEEITGLKSSQAIVFDMLSDSTIYYN